MIYTKNNGKSDVNQIGKNIKIKKNTSNYNDDDISQVFIKKMFKKNNQLWIFQY